ncbi:MAG TPA: YjcZ family sporulation protein [Pseudogracilibacillus sp.]|nr:YjcZ family sporulation protein [Pseudogracilibacillus sp.]
MGEHCDSGYRGFHGSNFAIYVVLFILLIIIGAIFVGKGFY